MIHCRLDCFYFNLVCAAKVSLLLIYNRLFKVSRSFRVQASIVGVAMIMFWYCLSAYA